MRRRTIFVSLGALVALVVAVAVLSAGKQQVRPDSVSKVAGTGDGQVGSTVGQLTATDVDGNRVSVPSGKPGALFFFAGWCGTCIPETVALGEVQRELGSRANVTAISSDPSDSVAAIREFRQRAGEPRYPFVWDSDSTIAVRLGVSALDTTIIYDAQGTVVFRDAGPTDRIQLLAALRDAGAS